MPKEKDPAAEVLGLANIVVSFRLTWWPDVEEMCRLLFPKNVRYDKLYHDLFQHQGEYEWLRMREISRSFSRQAQWSESDSEGDSLTVSEGEKEEMSEQEGWSDGTTKQASRGRADVNGWTQQTSSSSGDRESPIVVDGNFKRNLRTGASQRSDSNGTSGSHSDQSSETEGETHTKTGGRAKARGRMRSEALARQRSRSASEGGSEGESLTVAEKLLPLPKLVHVRQDTGQLQDSVSDQYEKFGSELSSLDRQEGFARVRGGKAVKFRTADVPDPFASPTAQMKAVAWFKKRLYQTHAYFFVPSDDAAVECPRQPEAQEEPEYETEEEAATPFD